METNTKMFVIEGYKHSKEQMLKLGAFLMSEGFDFRMEENTYTQNMLKAIEAAIKSTTQNLTAAPEDSQSEPHHSSTVKMEPEDNEDIVIIEQPAPESPAPEPNDTNGSTRGSSQASESVAGDGGRQRLRTPAFPPGYLDSLRRQSSEDRQVSPGPIRNVGSEKSVCLGCKKKKTAITKAHARSHVINQHLKELSGFECKICNDISRTPGEIKDHFEMVHEGVRNRNQKIKETDSAATLIDQKLHECFPNYVFDPVY